MFLTKIMVEHGQDEPDGESRSGVTPLTSTAKPTLCLELSLMKSFVYLVKCSQNRQGWDFSAHKDEEYVT